VRLARDQRIAPTLFAGMRMREQDLVYDDPEHPDRVTRVINSPDYVDADFALLAGLDVFEKSLCPGCGWPREIAWHEDMAGWFEGLEVVCHACTAMQPVDEKTGIKRPYLHRLAFDNRLAGDDRLPPFVLGLTTTST